MVGDGQFQFRNWLFKKGELISFELELKFPTKIKLNPEINFLIQIYFFHENTTWNIN